MCVVIVSKLKSKEKYIDLAKPKNTLIENAVTEVITQLLKKESKNSRLQNPVNILDRKKNDLSL